MQSVLSQTNMEFEYIVVDGASKDGSIDVIKEYAIRFGNRMKWISEPDKGIYNAMNKGIGMASGEYVQFLNSGDILASDDVTNRMLVELNNNGNPSILYGNMLKDMPVDLIKLDMAFLQNSKGNERAKIILRSLIELVATLGMDSLTEGIETKKQFEVLTGYGCKLFQGYYFAKPMPVSEFEDYCKSAVPV